MMRNAELVKLLLTAPGIDFNKKSIHQLSSIVKEYCNALHMAIMKTIQSVFNQKQHEFHEILKILLDCKTIDVNSKHIKTKLIDYEREGKYVKSNDYDYVDPIQSIYNNKSFYINKYKKEKIVEKSPLCLAIIMNDVFAVKLLLSRPDININENITKIIDIKRVFKEYKTQSNSLDDDETEVYKILEKFSHNKKKNQKKYGPKFFKTGKKYKKN